MLLGFNFFLGSVFFIIAVVLIPIGYVDTPLKIVLVILWDIFLIIFLLVSYFKRPKYNF